MMADLQTIRKMISEFRMMEMGLEIESLKEATVNNHLEAARYQERSKGVGMAIERLTDIEFEETQRENKKG